MADPLAAPPAELALAWIDGDTARQIALPLPPGAPTVEAALRAALAAGAGPASMIAAALTGQAGLALHGLRARPDDPVEAGDRIELLTPILADAKAARHARVEAARAVRGRNKWRPDWRDGDRSDRSAGASDREG